MDSIVEFFKILNSISPFAVLAGIVTLVILVWHPEGPINKIANNHLGHVQETLEKICDNGEKQLEALGDIKEGISYLKGRVD